jgi:hypothetical protein
MDVVTGNGVVNLNCKSETVPNQGLVPTIIGG